MEVQDSVMNVSVDSGAITSIVDLMVARKEEIDCLLQRLAEAQRRIAELERLAGQSRLRRAG
jgi:hypothetical protein